jgi:hypothetical protein
MVIPVAIIVALLGYILIYGRMKWKVTALYAFGVAVLCWTAAIVVNAQPAFNYADFTVDDWLGQFSFFRYAAAPSMFLLTLVPVACCVAGERSVDGRWKAGAAAPVLMVVFLLMNYFPATTTRQTGPEWDMGVDAARSACSTDSSLKAATVHAAPTDWRIDVPCGILLKR